MPKETFEPKIMRLTERDHRDELGNLVNVIEVEFMAGDHGPFHFVVDPGKATKDELVKAVQERVDTIKAIYELTS